MLLVFVLGFLFGAVLQYSGLNRYNTISGMAMLKDLTMAKAIAVAIGAGIILVNIEIGLGFASYHIKPLLLGGVIIGGILFGIGMAILGYCPGTIPISAGEGSLDAVTGLAGGLAGGIVYTLVLPSIKGMLGPDYGQIALAKTLSGNNVLFFLVAIAAGISMIFIAFRLNKIERVKKYDWLISGAGIAIITAGIFLTTISGRVLGASGTYPYVGNLVAGLTENDYFKSIAPSGRWELWFLGGAFFSGLVLSLLRRDFRFTLIHENWRKHRGNSKSGRIIWAFVAGFLLIFGARMAGGCTSGHIISGGMQLALSSYLFAGVVFGAFLLTGRIFYRKHSVSPVR